MEGLLRLCWIVKKKEITFFHNNFAIVRFVFPTGESRVHFFFCLLLIPISANGIDLLNYFVT